MQLGLASDRATTQHSDHATQQQTITSARRNARNRLNPPPPFRGTGVQDTTSPAISSFSPPRTLRRATRVVVPKISKSHFWRILGLPLPQFFVFFARSFFDLFFASIFQRFWNQFHFHFGTGFCHFGIILASLFRASNLYRFVVDLSLNFGAFESHKVWFYCSRSIVFAKSLFREQIGF